MNKTVLSIQDLSCHGKCSLTVSLPILSAMGLSVSVLPTGLLSSHTGGFGVPAKLNTTDFIRDAFLHWNEQGVTFDGVCCGYFSESEQIDFLYENIGKAVKNDGFVLVDPVMGDNGGYFSGIDPTFSGKMKKLCSKADVITPNLTELCFMSGKDYNWVCNKERVFSVAGDFQKTIKNTVIVTGVSFDNKMCCIVCENDGIYEIPCEKREGKFHGTGDIFASVVAGSILNGNSVHDAVEKAVAFVTDCIDETLNKCVSERNGLCFENVLSKLIGSGKNV